HEVLGMGRASQASADWPGSYTQADVASSDLSGLVKEFAPDVVLHGAGTASVSASLSYPLDDLRAAALTWANTLDGVRRSGLRPLVLFPSSAAVYGNRTDLPIREEMHTHPISPYGFHKVACELLAQEYAECFGLNVIVFRLFSVFGEAQRRLLIWELYKQMTSEERDVRLQGTGEESRDYLHIDDVTGALFHLIFNQMEETQQGRCLIINIASGEETNVLHLAHEMSKILGVEKEIRCRGIERAGDPRKWRADISQLRSLAPQWQPQPFSQRLAQCLNAWE
ncbi:MAG: NAD-dependent epimerase/dehydratase family protein, partial [Pyrinomonadaceae bacterium]